MDDEEEIPPPPPPPPPSKTLPADKEPEIRQWSLPDELTKSILVRLPANELIGCKLVSKLWLSLISSPDFISDHIKRFKSDPENHLLLFHYDPPFSPLECPPNPFRSTAFFCCPQLTVVGSANGLICVVGRSFHRKMTATDIWILNPVTGHVLKLPRPPRYPTDERSCFDDEGLGNAYFVFWWVSDTDEYKVARIVPKRDYSNTTVASVWVSGSPETWSEIPVGFDGAFHRPSQFVSSGCDIVVGDIAYWIVFKVKVIDRRHIRDMFVLSLDLRTLSLSLSKSPFPLHYSSHFTTTDSLFKSLVYRTNNVMFAANWKGKFVLAERVDGPKMYDVWTMDDVEGWSKDSSFDYPILKWINDVKGKTVIMITVHPLYDENGIVSYGIGRGGAELDELECGIALFDIGTGEAEPIKDFILGHHMASAHDFVGSLVSIKGFKPLEAADELSQRLRVIWPEPSAASRMIGNCERKIRVAKLDHKLDCLFFYKYFMPGPVEEEE